MNIILNNELIELEDDQSLQKLINSLGMQDSKFAIALNHTFIPKFLYHDTKIKDQDIVDLIIPMQGG